MNAPLMIECAGCGSSVEAGDVVEMREYSTDTCERCRRCEAVPELREAYRRGFNAGLSAMARAARNDEENLRRSKLQSFLSSERHVDCDCSACLSPTY